MNIYAIGDLHLSQDESKSMEKFGWIDYDKKIFNYWDEIVKDDDIVLIAGDISWAMKLEEAILDLDRIHKKKGTKVLIKGNHDYWWSSITKLNSLYEDMIFLQNSAYKLDDYVICGSRLWISPNENNFTKQDEKIYKREMIRLENSLKIGEETGKKIILMTHYPPTSDNQDNNGFLDIIKNYNVIHMVYGHLHGSHSYDNSLKGEHFGVNFHLVSCDYLDFKLKKII